MNTQDLGKFVAYKDAVLIMPFVESRGLPHDFSKYRNNATFDNAKWRRGMKEFDGVDDYIRIPDSISLDITNKITIMILVKKKKMGNEDNYIISKQVGGQSGYRMAIRYTNIIHFAVYSADSFTAGETDTIDAIGLQWNHIMGEFDGDVNKIYVNGILSITEDIPLNHIDTNNYDLEIGRNRATQSQYLDGYLNFVGIYTCVISDSGNKSAYYYSNPHKRLKPTCVTRRGCYQAVKNIGDEVDGRMMRSIGVM